MMPGPEIPPDSPIQEVFRILTKDAPRNRRIADDILTAYREGRMVLVLTEQPQLARMWDKRQRGYRAMGYEIRAMATNIVENDKSLNIRQPN